MGDFAHRYVQLFDEYWFIIIILWTINIMRPLQNLHL